MKQLPAHIIDRFKKAYGLSDWKITVKMSKRHKGETCGNTLIRTPYNEAAIVLYPRIIRKTKQNFPLESVECVLHHEFAHIVLEAYAENVPKKVRESKEVCGWQEQTADHIGTIMGLLTYNIGIDAWCIEEGI